MESSELSHWWGAAGAVGCGLGVRFFPGVIAAAGAAGAAVVVAMCLLMLEDAFAA